MQVQKRLTMEIVEIDSIELQKNDLTDAISMLIYNFSYTIKFSTT